MADVTDLLEAIDAYRADAAQRYNDAQFGLEHPPAASPPPVPPLPPETREQANKRNQGLLAAAFSQLANAESMLSAQQGREGYEQVVKLMTTTATAAEAISIRLAALAQSLVPVAGPPTPPPLVPTFTGTATAQEKMNMMNALTLALHALAQVSPVSVWEKGPTSGGAAG